MKISILGTRGIPARYGGFETFAENLSAGLVKKGHRVTVYCRSHYAQGRLSAYKGVDLVVLGTVRHKYLDTVAHTLLSALHAVFTKTDIIYFCNAVNSVFIIIPKLMGKKSVINVDGLEWKRKKWNRLAKFIYRASERLATLLADRIVTDSMAIRDYYRERFGVDTEYISYGADIKKGVPPGAVMAKYGLKKRGYLLYVSRLEPENNAHILVAAYEKAKGDMPLLIVGDAPYNKGYIAKLKSTKDKRIKFLGSIYAQGYEELLSNAYAYIHGNEVGGTNPALLEAMAAANCVVVNGVPFNREVIGDCGLWYEPGNAIDLKDKIEYLFDNPHEAEKYRASAVERIRKYYRWEDAVNKTEDMMEGLLEKRGNR